MSLTPLKQASLCWFTLAEHLALILICFTSLSGKHRKQLPAFNKWLPLTRAAGNKPSGAAELAGTVWWDRHSQTNLTVGHSSQHQPGCPGTLGLGWEPWRVYNSKCMWVALEITWYMSPSQQNWFNCCWVSALSLCLYFYSPSTRYYDNLSTSKVSGVRNGRDQDVKSRAGNTSLVSGHLQRIWSFSVTLWGRKQSIHSAGWATEAGMCYVLQACPSETISSKSQCLCSATLFLMMPLLLRARPCGRGQGVIIMWGLISWEHKIKTSWDLYLIPVFASDF